MRIRCAHLNATRSVISLGKANSRSCRVKEHVAIAPGFSRGHLGCSFFYRGGAWCRGAGDAGRYPPAFGHPHPWVRKSRLRHSLRRKSWRRWNSPTPNASKRLRTGAEAWRAVRATDRTRTVSLPTTLAPGSHWNPVLPGHGPLPSIDRFVRSTAPVGPLPGADADIAYAPVWKLSRWLEHRQLTSERLTHIYLDRIARFDPKLRCVITLTPELALDQARRADREIAAGKYRGPLHGSPGAARICSTRPAFAPRTARSPSRTACRRGTPPSCIACMRRAPSCSRSYRSARWH